MSEGGIVQEKLSVFLEMVFGVRVTVEDSYSVSDEDPDPGGIPEVGFWT